MTKNQQRWRTSSLAEICLKITDGAHASPKSVENGFPMASVKDLTSFGINLESCRHISSVDFEKLVAQGCKPLKGDVLIAKDGNSALDTVCEIKNEEDIVLLSSVAILRPDPEKVISPFLRYYLDAEPTRQYLKQGFISGAAIPRVILSDFKRAEISYPDLFAQEKISKTLSAFDDLIENNTKRIKILENMARLIFREWFIYYRFPKYEKVKMVDSGTELGQIPEGWQVLRLEKVCESITSGGTPRTSTPEYWGGDIPWLSSGETGNNFIVETEKTITEEGVSESSTRLARLGCTVIASAGQGKTRGQTSMLRIDTYINQSIIALTADRKLITDSFLFFDLERRYNQFRQISDGSTRGSLTTKLLADLAVVVPSPELVSQFDSIVEPMVRNIELMLRKNNLLRRTRDLLLPKLISGQLAVA